MPLKLMYITNNPRVAEIAERYGVDRIWIDLETLGKKERQGGMDSVKSHHTVEDIAAVRPRLAASKVLVRINPWNNNSGDEIEAVIAAGADFIMLPMWRTKDEAGRFVTAVRRRAKTILLLETKEAVQCLDDVLETGGFDEIHIGLNDLHLSYGMDFMFEPLANGMVDFLCRKMQAAGVPYGFGGLARIGDGLLPAEKIVMEHYRLGSTRAILSRTFCDSTMADNIDKIESIFRENMQKLREYEKYAASAGEAAYLANRKEVIRRVGEIVGILHEKKSGQTA